MLSDRKINAVLYIILSLAIMTYMYLNVFSTESVFRAGHDHSIRDGISFCSCGGSECAYDDDHYKYLSDGGAENTGSENTSVTINEEGLDGDAATKTLQNSNNEEDQNTKHGHNNEIDPDTNIRFDVGKHKGTVFKEAASSVHMEEETEEKIHVVSQTGFHLYIDLDHMLMHVYKDGEPIKTYEVSGGKPNSPSPIGTWKIISKDTWGEGFGGAWLGFNVPWGKYGIHGTTEPWTIGRTNASKGCIRMRNKEVRELYRLVPHNAIVTIVYDNIPFYPMRDGDVGSDVLAVERALKKLGYYHGGEDGMFGASLKKAVMKFQKENKLYSTGVVNNSTYEKIMQMEKEYDKRQRQLKQEQDEERGRLEQELE